MEWIILIMAVSINSDGGAASNGAESAPRVDDFVEQARTASAQWLGDHRSFRVHFVRESGVQLGPHGGEQPREFVLARKGDGWLVAERLVAPGENDVPGWETSYCDRRRVLFWTKHDRACALDKLSSEGWNIYRGWLYFTWQGFCAPQAIADSAGVDYLSVEAAFPECVDHPFLPEFLDRNRELYRVLPDREDVDGIRCWVLEWPGMDRIWVDLEHGFAIRRRVYHWGLGKPRRYAIEQSDFREISRGFWTPFLQKVDKYAEVDRTEEKFWDTIVNKSVYRVKEVLVGDEVPDEALEVRLPAGTRVVDNIRDMVYTVAEDGAEPFEGALAEARDALRPNRTRWLLVALNAFLVAVAALIWFVRRRR